MTSASGFSSGAALILAARVKIVVNPVLKTNHGVRP